MSCVSAAHALREQVADSESPPYTKNKSYLPDALVKFADGEDGLPLNPFGRTGLSGRGSLYKWGPHLAICHRFCVGSVCKGYIRTFFRKKCSLPARVQEPIKLWTRL